MRTRKPFMRPLILNSICAGAVIALAAMVSSYVSYTIDSESIARLIRGIIFPFGLTIIVMLQLSLFTGNIYLFKKKLFRELGFGKMTAIWIVSFIGNFIGALIIVSALAQYFPQNFAEYTIKIAEVKTTLDFTQAIIYGILCNVLVCLGVVLAAKGATISQKFLGALLPVSLFVICGFEHSIANMYYIPAGMALTSTITPQMLGANLLPVTIGNIIGGLVIAIIMYYKEKWEY